MRAALVIARKELADSTRSAWIVSLAVVFLLVTLVASGMVSVAVSVGGDVALASIWDTIGTMRFVAAVVVPVLTLMLGHATIAGEHEGGSLSLLAAQPVTRAEILVGKFLGLWATIGASLAIGAGIGGSLVLVSTGEGLAGAQVLVVFLLETLLWMGAWAALTILVSAWFLRRTTAIAGSLVVWFLFSVLWVPLAVLLVAVSRPEGPVAPNAPPWLLALELLNPNGAYGGLASRTIGGYPGAIGAIVEAVTPLAATALTFFVALALWVALPLLGAYAVLRKRDL